MRKLLLLITFTACGPAVGTAEVEVTPTLAYVEPGVEVVADWDVPIFFADGFYWYWDDGIWYRSITLGGERVVVHQVPPAVAHIRAPGRFVHYHPTGTIARRPIPEHRWARQNHVTYAAPHAHAAARPTMRRR